MNNKVRKNSSCKEEIVRVSKKDKVNMNGATNWAFLISDERKENSKK